MNITNKTVLITGANRGIGRALVEEALRRGAKKVYAGTRGTWQHADKRVRPITLDVTDAGQIERAAGRSSASTSSSTTRASRSTTISPIPT
jgi:NAD(P)-dependent dehydrogenase (short-subunit alcohol dehydrogenase family)